MQNFEFVDYKPTPNDKFMLGLATVRAYGKIVLIFKHVQTKSGAPFFCLPSYSVGEGVDKRYVSAATIDSRYEDQALQEFLKEQVKKYQLPEKVISMSEVAHDHVPF